MIPLTAEDPRSDPGPPPVFTSLDGPLTRAAQVGATGLAVLLLGVVLAAPLLVLIGLVAAAGPAIALPVAYGRRLRAMRTGFTAGRGA
jgi:hypothetical protein